MCGRFASSRTPEDLVEEFEVEASQVVEPLAPDYNVAPTKEIYAVLERPPRREQVAETGAEPVELPAERQLRVLRWGLVPSWAKDPGIGNRMINARSETVAEKPAFKRAFASRRCLIPADGYYEWYASAQRDATGRPVKQPFFIRPRDGRVLALAGLFELWRDPARSAEDPARWLWTATVLTTSATDDLGHLHERMPLQVRPALRDAWLDPEVPGSLDLLEPAMPGVLEAYPVSRLVSQVANNGPELIEPLPLEETR